SESRVQDTWKAPSAAEEATGTEEGPIAWKEKTGFGPEEESDGEPPVSAVVASDGDEAASSLQDLHGPVEDEGVPPPLVSQPFLEISEADLVTERDDASPVLMATIGEPEEVRKRQIHFLKAWIDHLRERD
ncbi:MAG: hypothetical protein ACE5ID_11765, partial [Acidobacteriota bacterium]